MFYIHSVETGEAGTIQSYLRKLYDFVCLILDFPVFSGIPGTAPLHRYLSLW